MNLALFRGCVGSLIERARAGFRNREGFATKGAVSDIVCAAHRSRARLRECLNLDLSNETEGPIRLRRQGHIERPRNAHRPLTGDIITRRNAD